MDDEERTAARAMTDTNETTSAPSARVVRPQRLLELEALCRALAAEIQSKPASYGDGSSAWKAITASCVVCKIEVSGAELLALSQPPSIEHATPKIGRLRLGDCARHGCDSLHYHLKFEPVEGIDWTAVLERIGTSQEAPGGQRRSRRSSVLDVLSLTQHPFARRIALGVIAIVALLMLRQWYIGGRIFLIREPQKFYAAPPPERPASTQE